MLGDDPRHLTQKIEMAKELLVRYLSYPTVRGTSLREAIASILQNGGQISVDRVAHDLGMSGRQLERRFMSDVGLGPKLLCRILRFQQVFRAVERSDVNWAKIAVECGYFDQAHLIRDFRQFAGQSPGALFENYFTSFAEFFTRKHRASDFYNTQG
jgi:transcriptional regulator GlxA family with amidase domain